MRRPYMQHGSRHGKHGSDPIPGIIDLRIVSGQTDGLGDITEPGTGGWSIDDYEPGETTISFDAPFGSPPIIVATQATYADEGPATAQIADTTETGFILRTFDNATDTLAPFLCNFIAVGT